MYMPFTPSKGCLQCRIFHLDSCLQAWNVFMAVSVQAAPETALTYMSIKYQCNLPSIHVYGFEGIHTLGYPQRGPAGKVNPAFWARQNTIPFPSHAPLLVPRVSPVG